MSRLPPPRVISFAPVITAHRSQFAGGALKGKTLRILGNVSGRTGGSATVPRWPRPPGFVPALCKRRFAAPPTAAATETHGAQQQCSSRCFHRSKEWAMPGAHNGWFGGGNGVWGGMEGGGEGGGGWGWGGNWGSFTAACSGRSCSSWTGSLRFSPALLPLVGCCRSERGNRYTQQHSDSSAVLYLYLNNMLRSL